MNKLYQDSFQFYESKDQDSDNENQNNKNQEIPQSDNQNIEIDQNQNKNNDNSNNDNIEIEQTKNIQSKQEKQDQPVNKFNYQLIQDIFKRREPAITPLEEEREKKRQILEEEEKLTTKLDTGLSFVIDNKQMCEQTGQGYETKSYKVMGQDQTFYSTKKNLSDKVIGVNEKLKMKEQLKEKRQQEQKAANEKKQQEKKEQELIEKQKSENKENSQNDLNKIEEQEDEEDEEYDEEQIQIEKERKSGGKITLDGDEFKGSMRYFNDNTTNISIICRRCGQSGHFERMCSQEVTYLCIQCLGNHNYRRCTVILCYKCNQDGHFSRECQAQGKPCFKCRKMGHNYKDCGVIDMRQVQKDRLNDYQEVSTKDLKRLRCIICSEKGHLNCSKRVRTDRIDFIKAVGKDIDIKKMIEEEQRKKEIEKNIIKDMVQKENKKEEKIQENEEKKHKKDKKSKKDKKEDINKSSNGGDYLHIEGWAEEEEKNIIKINEEQDLNTDINLNKKRKGNNQFDKDGNKYKYNANSQQLEKMNNIAQDFKKLTQQSYNIVSEKIKEKTKKPKENVKEQQNNNNNLLTKKQIKQIQKYEEKKALLANQEMNSNWKQHILEVQQNGGKQEVIQKQKSEKKQVQNKKSKKGKQNHQKIRDKYESQQYQDQHNNNGNINFKGNEKNKKNKKKQNKQNL